MKNLSFLILISFLALMFSCGGADVNEFSTVVFPDLSQQEKAGCAGGGGSCGMSDQTTCWDGCRNHGYAMGRCVGCSQSGSALNADCMCYNTRPTLSQE